MNPSLKENQPVFAVSESSRTSDMPQASSRFWDRMAERYAAKPVPDEAIYARKLEMTREHLNPDSSVLELGCGTGSTAISHAALVQKIRATDFSREMITIARRKAVAADITNIEFVHGSIDREALLEETYDAVLALSVLHLLADWPRVIETAYQQLKPGGVFITSTPCLQDSHSWLQWIAPVGLKFGLLPMLSFISQSELRAALLRSGFSIERCWQPGPKTGVFIVAAKSC